MKGKLNVTFALEKQRSDQRGVFQLMTFSQSPSVSHDPKIPTNYLIFAESVSIDLKHRLDRFELWNVSSVSFK